MNPLTEPYDDAAYRSALNDLPSDLQLDAFAAWLLLNKGIDWRAAYPGMALSHVYELYRPQYAQHVLMAQIINQSIRDPSAREYVNTLRWTIDGLDAQT